MARFRSFLLNSSLVVVVIAICLAIAFAVDSWLNLGLRFAVATLFQKNVQEAEPIMYVWDNETGWRLNPRTQYHRSRSGPFLGLSSIQPHDTRLRVNSEGFIDRDHFLTTPYYRIAFAGSSWVEAVQLEYTDRFAPLTENYVYSKSSGAKVIEVMNFGTSNASPAHSYGILKHYALKYKPDEVWLFVTPGDLRANTPIDTPPPFGPSFVFTADQKELADIRFGFVDPPAYAAAKRQKELEKIGAAGLNFAAILPYHYSTERSPVYDRVWRDMELTVSLVHRTLKAAGIKVRMVYIPPRYEIDPQLWEQWTRQGRKAVGRDIPLDPAAGEKRFAALAASLGSEFISLTALCREKGPAEMYGDHFSRMGHHWVADYLAKVVIDTVPASAKTAPQ